MKLDFGPKTQSLLVSAVMAIALFFAALFGYNVQSKNVVVNLPGVGGGQTTIDAKAVTRNGIVCDSGETNCIESYGMNVLVNNAAGTQKFKVTASSGNTDVAGDLAVTGSNTSTGALIAGTFLRMTPSTAITVTNGAAFTPTASYQPIQAAGNVTPTITVNTTAGTLLRLVNTSNTDITIADSGTTMLSGNIVLGQYDSLLLMSDGTNWIQMGTSNN